MYRRNGKSLPEPEEGASYFQSEFSGLGVVPPRPLGLQRGMLTNCFVPSGIGADADAAAPAPMATSAIAVTAAVFAGASLLTFLLARS